MPERSAVTTNYAVQSTAVVAGVLSFDQWIALAGLGLMLLSFGLSAWLQIRKDQRDSKLAQLKEDSLKRRKDDG